MSHQSRTTEVGDDGVGSSRSTTAAPPSPSSSFSSPPPPSPSNKSQTSSKSTPPSKPKPSPRMVPSPSPPPPPQPFEVAVARKLEARSHSLLDTFLTLDVDGDGYVTRLDLKRALHNTLGIDLTTDQMNVIFARFAYFEQQPSAIASSRDDGGRDVGGEEEEKEESPPRKRPSGAQHGIRYGEFVQYIHDTASTLLPSSAVYGSTLNLHSDEDEDVGIGKTRLLLPRMYTIQPPPDAVTRDLRLALLRLLRQHTKSGIPGSAMMERDLFLSMDNDRSGYVTPQQFQAWVQRMGLALSQEQVKTLLGKHYKPKGINLHEFALAMEEMEDELTIDHHRHDDDDDASPELPWWEKPDETELRRRRLAARAAAEIARDSLHRAVHQCVDDSKSDYDIIHAIATQLYYKKTTLLEAFRKYDTEGTGKLSPMELREALMEAGGMDVSLERAKSLVDKFDRDGDGTLNKSEFVRLIASSSNDDGGVSNREKEKSGDHRVVGEAKSPTSKASTTTTTATAPATPAVARPSTGSAKKQQSPPIITTAASTEEQREALVIPIIGHEEEEIHREVAEKLDEEDLRIILNFREALEEERLITRKMFESMDKDKSKDLTAEELRKGFERMGINVSQQHINHIMKRFDPEGTGRLRYYQFIKMLSANLDV